MKPEDQENITNLTALWHCMGSTNSPLSSGAAVEQSFSWPHRLWIAPDVRLNESELGELRSFLAAAPTSVFPVWGGAENPLSSWLEREGYGVSFKQTAMHLPESQAEWPRSDDLVVKSVSDVSRSDEWTRVAAESFGYSIDPVVVRGLLGSPDLDLLVANRPDGETIGTALLLEQDRIVGIHMMGVLPDHRRAGVARQIFHELLRRAVSRRPADVVLQASVMGEGLYRSLGFASQFEIWNFGVGASGEDRS